MAPWGHHGGVAEVTTQAYQGSVTLAGVYLPNRGASDVTQLESCLVILLTVIAVDRLTEIYTLNHRLVAMVTRYIGTEYITGPWRAIDSNCLTLLEHVIQLQ